MTPANLTSIAHMAPVGRTMELNLTVIALACAALGVVALSMWAQPTLAGSRFGSPFSGKATTSQSIGTRMPPWRLGELAAFLCLGGFALAAAVFTTYLTRQVPVDVPTIEGAAAQRYWPAALASASVVAVVDGAAILFATRRRSRAVTGANATGEARPPELRFEFISSRLITVSAGASAVALVLGLVAGLPLWCVAIAAGVPWLPALTVESTRKFDHYGLYAFFLVVAGLQAGHVGEHTTQVTQLMMYDGNLARSHGVFGQLDFETVHFYWDTAVWLSTAILVSRFYGSRWLWVSFAAASLHEVEHIYLYWLYLFHEDFYMEGGLAGIMGRGGVIGSPLYRPYLHFLYNTAVAIPMLVAVLELVRPARKQSNAMNDAL